MPRAATPCTWFVQGLHTGGFYSKGALTLVAPEALPSADWMCFLLMSQIDAGVDLILIELLGGPSCALCGVESGGSA